ncbi:WecB/TagA/CpsF family glycosyltransferase [Thalassospira lucentensis]|uniref:WecB/TagA/CpsF family glycosyltransferase n=1 Tax=Thalassospira lucentensis TaxID=168935 RepID=UPI00142E4747|nr:WecB/TagA/CpsF family glycosyltransferase [Thalassospira lucentensis]NIZ01281.1 WecB/TagA/CpsF family glycosyltransferase [Thalassospira lucentensis]
MAVGVSAFFGLQLDLRAQETLCDDICNWLDRQTVSPVSPAQHCFRHHCLNAVKLPHAQSDPALFKALSTADCLSPDGMGIVWAARLLGLPVSARVTGIDVMAALMPRFAKMGTRIFLLGAAADVVAGLRDKLRAQYPGLVIAGHHHGYEPDDEKLATIIRNSRADALFVALPSPRKEMFVHNIAPKTGCRFAMGVGGAFDVLAGKVQRAPMIWQRCGLEFLWRILCQPRAMIPRYASGLWGFAKITVPAIIRYQMRRWQHLLTVPLVSFLLIGLIISRPISMPVSARTIDRPALVDEDMSVGWLRGRLADMKTADDLDMTISEIVAWIIPEELRRTPDENDATASDDWNALDGAIKAALVVFETVLKMSGGQSFLIEAVIGGVLARLFDLHPDPARVERLVISTAPNVADTIFGRERNLLFDHGLMSATPFDRGVQPTRGAGPNGPADKDQFGTALPFATKQIVDDFRDENASWGRAESEETAAPFEPEDASPR